MPAVSRRRRAEIQQESARVRARGQREHWPVERIVTAIRSALPEVSALEGWRLAYGWPRSRVIDGVAALYVVDGLRPPGLNPAMLCRWEHGEGQPGAEYSDYLVRLYRADAGQLELTTRCRCGHVCVVSSSVAWYGHDLTPNAMTEGPEALPMTTAGGFAAVRESLSLALSDQADSYLLVEVADAAVEHYARNYSRHPPAALFDEIYQVRGLLAASVSPPADVGARVELTRSVGWLSALLGNLAYHLDDPAGARAHLATAAELGRRTGDAHLTAWSRGAAAMVACHRLRFSDALAFADEGLGLAPTRLVRAQLLAWAKLPALAGLGRADDADDVLADAADAMEADPDGQAPGRFGFDPAEFELHAAEAHLTLGRPERAARHAEASRSHCRDASPGWAAATLVLARAEATRAPGDASARALDVLDRISPDRLRSTARARLTALDHELTDAAQPRVQELRDRLRVLPPPVDVHGRGATA